MLQRYYRAQDKGFLVQAGYSFVKQFVEYTDEFADAGGVDASDTSSYTTFSVNGEYGLLENLALGLNLTRSTGPGYEGMGDYIFYAKGQFNRFFYQANFNFSPEKAEDDTVYSGGNYLDFILGVHIFKGLGVRFAYQPEFDYEVKDSDADFKSGSQTMFEAFYEHQIEEHTVGGAIQTLTIDPDKEDGEKQSRTMQYMVLEGYGVFPVMKGLSIVPAISYMRLINDVKISGIDVFDSVTFTNLQIEARYEF